jgi:hypothetical protein
MNKAFRTADTEAPTNSEQEKVNACLKQLGEIVGKVSQGTDLQPHFEHIAESVREGRRLTPFETRLVSTLEDESRKMFAKTKDKSWFGAAMTLRTWANPRGKKPAVAADIK